MKVFVFGNEFVKDDSLAKSLAEKIEIEGMDFIDCKSPNDMFSTGEKNPIILDVVENISKVTVLGIDDLKGMESSTAHDLDLGFMLKLYKELGMVNDAKIIGVPMKCAISDTMGDVKKILENLCLS